MSSARRTNVMLAAIVIAALGAACDSGDPTRAQLDRLVAVQASRQDVANALGPGYTWYAPDTDNWKALLEFLAREPASQYEPVRKAVRERRIVMYYTSMWQQTWLFLDKHERITSYWLNTQ